MDEKILKVVMQYEDRMTKPVQTGTKKVTDNFKKIQGAIKATIAIAAGLMIFRQVSRWMSESVKMAADHEFILAKLNQTIKGNTDALQKQAAELQNLTGISDDYIMNAQAMLGTFQLGEQEVKKLTPAILDMAVAVKKSSDAQVDLQSVAIALGKAFTSGTGMLSRYGVAMTDAQRAAFDTAEGMEKVNVLVEILDSNFEGLATAVGQTFTGSMDKLREAWVDWREEVGGFITQSPRVIDSLNVLTALVVDLTNRTKELKVESNDLVGQGFTRIAQGAVWVAVGINKLIGFFNVLAIGINTYVRGILVGFNAVITMVGKVVDVFASLPGNMLPFGFNEQDVQRAIASAKAFSDQYLLELNQRAVGLADNILNLEGDLGTLYDAIAELENIVSDTNTVVEESAHVFRDLSDAEDEVTDSTSNTKDAFDRLSTAVKEAIRALKELIDLGPQIGDIWPAPDMRYIEDISKYYRQRQGPSLGGPAVPKGGPGAAGGLLGYWKQGISALSSPETQFNLLGAGITAFGQGGFSGGMQTMLPMIGNLFGPVGGAIGTLLGGLFGKKRRGNTKQNPVYVEEVRKSDFATALLQAGNMAIFSGAAGNINRINNSLKLQARTVMSG